MLLYTSLFSLFYTCKEFCLILNSPTQSCVLREIIWDSGIRPVLNSPTDNKGKRGENKQGWIFPNIQYTLFSCRSREDWPLKDRSSSVVYDDPASPTMLKTIQFRDKSSSLFVKFSKKKKAKSDEEGTCKRSNW